MKQHKVSLYITSYSMNPTETIILTDFMSVCVNSCVHYIFFICLWLLLSTCTIKFNVSTNIYLREIIEKSFTDMNTKTLNTYEKLWLANRASHNMALAGPTAFWLASGHREARPLLSHIYV